jgi:predicted ATPase
MASAIRDSRLLADLGNVAGILACSCGNLREAASHFESALRELPKMSRAVSPQTGLLYGSMIPCQVAFNLQQLGRVSEARRAAEESLNYARSAGHLFSVAYAHYARAFLALRWRQADLACTYSEEAIAVSEEHGFAEWLRQGRFFHGWALAELGQTVEGLTEMESGIAEIERFGGAPQLQYFRSLRAQRLAKDERWAEALPVLDRSLAHLKDSGERAAHAEILRLRGEVLLMRDRSETPEAEKCFRAALEVARAQEAKCWELRTSLSLSRLLRDTNRRDEARAVLSAIYNWFTEGFELPDLKDAKALLEELK